MRFLRWKGLIAFVVIISALAFFWFILADFLVKRGIEKAGTKINGARVDLASADLSLFPLGLTLRGLQVSDRHEPMKNLVEAERISFLMEPGYLFFKKVLIDEMTVDGIRFGTPRKYSGAIAKVERKEKKGAGLFPGISMPAVDIPDAKDIMKRESLDTLKAAEEMKKELAEGQARWKKRIDELPDEKRVSEYERRLKDLEKQFKGGITGALQGLQEAEKLSKDIESEIRNLEKTGKEFKGDVNRLQARVREIESMPEKDLKRLKEKYSFTSGSMGNYSMLLLGGKIGGWVIWGQEWYGKASPYIERAAAGDEKKEPAPERMKGTDVRFREFNPRPDFLVKLARVSVSLPDVDMKGTIENISSDQRLTGKPMTFALHGEKMKNMDSIDFRGEINGIARTGAFSRFNLTFRGYDIRNVKLSESEEFPVTIKAAKAALEVDTTFRESGFDTGMKGKLEPVVMEGGLKKKGVLSDIVSSSLSGIKGFSFSGKISQKGEDHSMDLSSDLDDVLKESMGKSLKGEVERFEKELRQMISDNVAKPLEEIRKEMQGMGKMTEGIDSKRARLEKVVEDIKRSAGKKMKFKF